jgi:hypothetical protein
MLIDKKNRSSFSVIKKQFKEKKPIMRANENIGVPGQISGTQLPTILLDQIPSAASSHSPGAVHISHT